MDACVDKYDATLRLDACVDGEKATRLGASVWNKCEEAREVAMSLRGLPKGLQTPRHCRDPASQTQRCHTCWQEQCYHHAVSQVTSTLSCWQRQPHRRARSVRSQHRHGWCGKIRTCHGRRRSCRCRWRCRCRRQCLEEAKTGSAKTSPAKWDCAMKDHTHAADEAETLRVRAIRRTRKRVARIRLVRRDVHGLASNPHSVFERPFGASRTASLDAEQRHPCWSHQAHAGELTSLCVQM